jgi:phenylalanyl-tRNA synthetase beta chain
MKTPLSWLSHYIDLSGIAPSDIAHRLTFSGIELEGIETLGGSFNGLIAAEVRAVEKHPQADKLSVCRVFDGQEEHQVVCGAPNVAADGKYPFAPIGAVLLNGELKIKKAKLRGVESFGMLCSAAELGLSSDHSGLMTLDHATAPGTPMAELLGPPDTVFELEITPNRPDCLSLIGIARELAALYDKPLIKPEISISESGPEAASEIRVQVEDAHDCPRYTARVLHNVKIGPSPAWMKDRLEKAGIRSINNVVDITNYVMLETGHPLHAFDLRLLAGGAINVRRARPGEKMSTLDDIERELDPDMLVIADANKPVALAGVMGGAGSEIQDDTSSVLLESATFDPARVRYASRKLMLFTDSSYRFERGVNAETVEWASRRAAQLMIELAGATLHRGVVDVRGEPAPEKTITLRCDRARSLLGAPVSNERIAEILRSIELDVSDPSDGTLHVRIPSFRFDLEREVDLIEEVARLYGLDNIPSTPSAAAPNPKADDTAVRQVASLRDHCIHLGLQETVTYSLVSEALMNLFDKNDAASRIALPRPVTTDQAILRTRLTPQLVETLGRNRARQIQQAAIFEIGTVYHQDEAGAYRETRHLGVGLMGRPHHGGALDRKAPSREEMFSMIKGIWERIAAFSRIANWSLIPEAMPFLEPGNGFALSIGGQPAGWLGLISPAIRKEWRLNDPVAVLEVAVAPVAHHAAPRLTYQPVPTFPSVTRDVALVADASLHHDDIIAAMRKAGPPELESIALFDIFTGASLGEGKRSLAYALTYRSSGRTLTDDEVNVYHEHVKRELKTTLQIDIREG